MKADPEDLSHEAEAFDSQIEQRIANGHIPDLRLCTPCDWFYNNAWRRPEYVRLDFGEQFELIRDVITNNSPKGVVSRVLEVGCGPGYLCLELARSGFDVTGIDVSTKCIEVASSYAATEPLKPERIKSGSALTYLCGDFHTHPCLRDASFDAVVFLGALHHFPDQDQTLQRARSLLKDHGLIIAHEPTRDRVTKGNAAFVHMLRVILSAQAGFYKRYEPTSDPTKRDAEIETLFREMRYELEGGRKAQSVNDNEAGYAEMHPALNRYFSEIRFEWRYAFFHEFIGGLRFDEHTNVELARYLRDIDRELCRLGVLQATEFFYVGRRL